MAQDIAARMRQLIGSTSEWGANDIVIGEGELAFEIRSDGKIWIKVGNGTAKYSALAYVAGPTSGDASSLALLLAGPTGSAQVGFKAADQPAIAAVQRTQQDKDRDDLGALDYGIVADGTNAGTGTDNLAKLNQLLTDRHREIVIPDGLIANVSNPITDVFGPRMGPGRVMRVLNANGDTLQLNLEADRFQHIFGEEYLYAWHQKLQNRSAVQAVFSGDSTTAGSSVAQANQYIDKLVQQFLREAGYDVTVTNKGVSGINTEQWRTTYLAAELALAPDLWVIRYGVNDPSYLKSNANTGGTTDGYTGEYALRRDPGDFATSLRSALTTIRASRDVSQTSILLMVQNATSDSPNGRDEKWTESVRHVVKKAARDFQCAFMDTYALWNGARTSATRWQDNPYSDGRAIHPLGIMNFWIANRIVGLIAPGAGGFRNPHSSYSAPSINVPPASFPLGHSVYYVTNWSINGVTYGGLVVTFRSADGIAWQTVVDGVNNRRQAERSGQVGPNTWNEWVSAPASGAVIAPQNGWTANGRGITVEKANGLCHLRGRLAGGTVTTGTVIATLPVGYRPTFDEYRCVPCGAGLATSGIIAVQSTGNVIAVTIGSNTLLDIGCVFSLY